MTKCSYCYKVKEDSEFYKRSEKDQYTRKSLLRSLCKFCMNKKDLEKKQKVKEKAVKYKGGKCQNCNYNKCISALEFHHLDSKTKEFNIATVRNLNEKVYKELDKCVLICSNCHREEHEKLKLGDI